MAHTVCLATGRDVVLPPCSCSVLEFSRWSAAARVSTVAYAPLAWSVCDQVLLLISMTALGVMIVCRAGAYQATTSGIGASAMGSSRAT